VALFLAARNARGRHQLKHHQERCLRYAPGLIEWGCWCLQLCRVQSSEMHNRLSGSSKPSFSPRHEFLKAGEPHAEPTRHETDPEDSRARIIPGGNKAAQSGAESSGGAKLFLKLEYLFSPYHATFLQVI
jgi:hypothetical protein